MSKQMKVIWRKADAVCFDVDSTVTTEEGIDELAKFCKKESDVAQLTTAAMSGNMKFRESLMMRLDIISPSLTQMEDFVKSHRPKYTPNVQAVVKMLRDREIPVYLISGGFDTIIAPVAEKLGIPSENVFANKLQFNEAGEYTGFDESCPTSKNGGKATVIESLKNKFGYKNLVLIGDGTTDLEAFPPADAFIGFGGNIIRESVQSKAIWYVTDFNELIEEFIYNLA